MDNRNKVYSVSELNLETKKILNQFFGHILVEGEISNLTIPSSGHFYFTLKDPGAQIRCAMFKGQQQRLSFSPKNGLKVQAHATVSLYEPRGDYQLIIDHLEPAGDGLLKQAFERLKEKLYKEGLFDEERKQAIPLIPTQIGLITSPTGAAVRDLLTVLKRRFPSIPVVIYPVSVQGENAKYEIAHAIEQANTRKETDVLILARGGGSLEDLWAFNEEMVARAIAKSQLPVISGIGHEIDFTIADLVADLRAATPSAAAEHAVPLQADWLETFRYFENRLSHLQIQSNQIRQKTLAWLGKSLKQQHPGQKLQYNSQRLDELEQRLKRSIGEEQKHLGKEISILEYRLRQWQPTQVLWQLRQKMHYMEQSLNQQMSKRLLLLRHKQRSVSQTLNAISPLATLERGYSITLDSQHKTLVNRLDQVTLHQRLTIRLKDGDVDTTVTGIKRHD